MDEENQNNEQQQNEAVEAVSQSNGDPKLAEIKQRALTALVPVLSNLTTVSAERKFDICLNAMRWTDNRELAGTALEAALAIDEPGTKAEALVELINEIDYLENN